VQSTYKQLVNTSRLASRSPKCWASLLWSRFANKVNCWKSSILEGIISS
jgi:hypothetical protein